MPDAQGNAAWYDNPALLGSGILPFDPATGLSNPLFNAFQNVAPQAQTAWGQTVPVTQGWSPSSNPQSQYGATGGISPATQAMMTQIQQASSPAALQALLAGIPSTSTSAASVRIPQAPVKAGSTPGVDRAPGYVEGGNSGPEPQTAPPLPGQVIVNSNGSVSRAPNVSNATAGPNWESGQLPNESFPIDPNTVDPNNPFAQFGLGQLPTSPQVNLGAMPMMSGEFSPEFAAQYGQNAAQQQNQIGGYWNAPQNAEAAQNNLGAVPQVNAQTPDSFAALQFLLSGQGFDPATLAKMHANATDTVANQGTAALSAARLAAERAGFGNSGMNVALQEQQARENAANQTTANNQIDVQNAQQGIQNLTAGAGMESNRQTNSAQQANLVALQNASNLIQAMNQNVANLQQTNMTNYAGNLATNTGKAQAQSGAAANAGQAYNTASLNQNVQANAGNAAAGQQWGLNQAQLTQGNNQFNVGQANSSNQNAMGNLVSLINQTSGVPAASAAASLTPSLNFTNPFTGALASAAQGAARTP